MKLLVVDGNSIANRAFYGIRLLSTKKGQYTNAVFGFLNILNNLMQRENPDGVVVAFDLKAPTFRHKLYSEYKAGRKPMPPELASQFPILKKLLALMGYHSLEIEGFEADDILGTLSLKAEQTNDVCVISTGDRDSLQLVSEHTTVLLATTKEIIEYTPQTLFEKYGLTPPQMIELKALMGDPSDHIPGVLGIGEKTASDLIKRYNNIEYIYDNLPRLEIKPSVLSKLEAGKDSAFLSKKLGTICRNVPISLDFSDYAITPVKRGELAKLLRELEFFKLLDKMGLSNEPIEDSDTDPGVLKDSNFKIIRFSSWLKSIQKKESDVVCILPDTKDNRLYFSYNNILTRADIAENSKDILSVLCDDYFKFTVSDSKQLYYLINSLDISVCVDFDLTLAGYLCSPSANSYNIERLANEYLSASARLDENEDGNFKLIADTALLSSVLKAKIEEYNMQFLMQDIELPLARLLFEMEKEGFLLDCQGLKAMQKKLENRISDLERDIHLLAGEEFNIKSPAQLGVILFEKLGLKSGKKTKTGYSTTAEVLEKLKNHHPIINLILEYRTLTKLGSTYCEGLLKAVAPDGRVHSTFNQTETRTGRISSLEPNLQNIPVRSEEGRELRRFFRAKPGYVLVDADYSQIELRVLAHMAKDTAMTVAFNNNEDIHTKTAGEVFNLPPVLVTPKMRSSAKAVNFGIVYGISAFSLAQDIGVTRKEAQDYIDGYFATYPQVKEYMEAVVEKAKADGYASTLFGRRRYLPELHASNFIQRSFGERVARNMPIQGTAADIIKLAMVKVRNSFLKSGLNAKIILQVHDELIVEASIEDSQKAADILKNEMEHAAELSVPLLVDIHKGETWYDAKG